MSALTHELLLVVPRPSLPTPSCSTVRTCVLVLIFAGILPRAGGGRYEPRRVRKSTRLEAGESQEGSRFVLKLLKPIRSLFARSKRPTRGEALMSIRWRHWVT